MLNIGDTSSSSNPASKSLGREWTLVPSSGRERRHVRKTSQVKKGSRVPKFPPRPDPPRQADVNPDDILRTYKVCADSARPAIGKIGGKCGFLCKTPNVIPNLSTPYSHSIVVKNACGQHFSCDPNELAMIPVAALQSGPIC